MAKPVRNYLITGMVINVLPSLMDEAVSIASKIEGIDEVE